MPAGSAKAIEFAARDDHRHALASTRQLDFNTSIGFVDDAWQAVSCLGDGVPAWHTRNVHHDVHGFNETAAEPLGVASIEEFGF